MPTALQRVQCLLQPETFALVKTLAGDERRTMSNMAAELIEKALKLPEVQAQIDAALIKVPTPDDPRASVPQRQVVNRQSYAVSPEEAEELRKNRGLEARVNRENEIAEMAFVPPEAPEGSVTDWQGGYLVPDGEGGFKDPDPEATLRRKQESRKRFQRRHETSVPPEFTPSEFARFEQLHMDGYVSMENYRMALARTELKPGETKEEARQRGHASFLKILLEAEGLEQQEAEARAKREAESKATEKRLAEQDDKLARMEQMMAQLLAAQQKG